MESLNQTMLIVWNRFGHARSVESPDASTHVPLPVNKQDNCIMNIVL